jgi:hypothetical protein
MMTPRSIASVNQLPQPVKEALYTRFIPAGLLQQFRIPDDFRDSQGRSLLDLRCASGATDMVLVLRRAAADPDPVLYVHLTDTMMGQIHILLYVVNDPDSPRFDVDRMPDGTLTEFGSLCRNLPAEEAACRAGLAPGQVHRGLRSLKSSIDAFEEFVDSLGQTMYHVEPLYYHVAIVFERYGFNYQQGRMRMEDIEKDFSPGGSLVPLLDGSSPFRQPSFAASIRGRSWAIHDGILGQPHVQTTMYKIVGQHAGVVTCPTAEW